MTHPQREAQRGRRAFFVIFVFFGRCVVPNDRQKNMVIAGNSNSTTAHTHPTCFPPMFRKERYPLCQHTDQQKKATKSLSSPFPKYDCSLPRVRGEKRPGCDTKKINNQKDKEKIGTRPTKSSKKSTTGVPKFLLQDKDKMVFF